MPRRSSRIVPLALVSLLATSALALAACGGSEGDSDRRASGGQPQAWTGQTGNSFGDYRGVEVDFINRRGNPVQVGIAAEGKFCPDNPDRDNPCRTKVGGTSPRDIPRGEFGKWKAYNGEILFNVDANRLGKYESTIAWPDDNEPEAGILGRITFSVTNPAIGFPRFTIKSGAGQCLGSTPAVRLIEGGVKVLRDQDPNCQIDLTITRLDDSKQFKRFTIKIQ
jgi:hypothetical protein